MRYVNGRARRDFGEIFEAAWFVVGMVCGVAWVAARILIVVAAGRIMGLW